MSEDSRQTQLRAWFRAQCPQLPGSPSPTASLPLYPVSGDASFRRYFRVCPGQGSFILMDAPPAQEDSTPFLSLAGSLAQAGVCVPRVFAWDLGQGFLCLEDLGDELYLPLLSRAADEADREAASVLYQAAFDELLKIQLATPALEAQLPSYDEGLLRNEVALFSDWLCRDFLALDPAGLPPQLVDALVGRAQAQPAVCVHRDYHSRNLLYRAGRPPGVIDFQDAVLGPFTYDLVSLLKDCYIAWPRSQVHTWALSFKSQAEEAGIIPAWDDARFLSDFELMGVQRHLKAAGIFARLWRRDGKPGYLRDIPRTIGYIMALEPEYAALPGWQAFQSWLSTTFMPALEQRLAETGEYVA